ncbi:MAG: DUF881 domain-containing protein [Nocardioides sp.]
MTSGPHERAGATAWHRRAWRAGRSWLTDWRVGTPLVFLACGALFVVSALDSEGTDLRPGRYTDLASLVEAEADEYAGLQDRVRDLNADVARLTAAVNDRSVNRYRDRIEVLEDPAGMTARTGRGVTVTLSDAPEDVINSSGQDLNLLIVHQQDIQAVVNAMWAGGATAVTVQGQRIISTTGIKCEGNAVQLQGVPYAQPYVISAVGAPADILESIEINDYLELYRSQAAIPDISVGWDLEVEDRVIAPAYDGLTGLSYAEPIS